MIRMTFAFLWMTSVSVSASDFNERILRAISLVESGGNYQAVGDKGKALGAWQIHPEAWADANAYLKAIKCPTIPRSRWKEPIAQNIVARALLCLTIARLEREGIKSPTPAQIALCWNLGFNGAKSRKFRANGYSRRVVQIY